MTERFSCLLPVVIAVLAACGVQPGEINLGGSVGERVAAVDGVTDFEHDSDELTFRGHGPPRTASPPGG